MMHKNLITSNLQQRLVSASRLLSLSVLVCALFGFRMMPNLPASEYMSTVPAATENNEIDPADYLFGIDVSHYQGKINWSSLKSHHESIHYVMIRATMGFNGIDAEYRKNYKEAKEHGFMVGVYHYYRPNENSARQFQHFSSKVKLEQGDFVPILDVERIGKYGVKNLRQGIINWLRLAEKQYGKKPIIYTGRNFYNEVLKGQVSGYPLWIADYTGKSHIHNIDWAFHQYTDREYIKGIPSRVDGNKFKGTLDDLKKLCL